MTSKQPIPTSRTTHGYLGATIAALAFAALPGGATDGPPPAPSPASTAVWSTTTEPSRPGHLIIRDEIDRALAERATPPSSTQAATPTAGRGPQGFSAVTTVPAVQRPAYLIIQGEIDRALAAREVAGDAAGQP